MILVSIPLELFRPTVVIPVGSGKTSWAAARRLGETHRQGRDGENGKRKEDSHRLL
jgi:hypothetical protein